MLARPSLCLFSFVVALLIAAVGTSTASAAQLETLLLTKTSPTSSEAIPANSTTPLVFGGEEGVIISVVHFGPISRAPITSGSQNPANEIAIYANPSCTGEPLNTGTLEELEQKGIQVTVPQDARTTLYATQSDPDGIDQTSKCPTVGLDYWESSKPVTPPVKPPPSGQPDERPGSSNAPVAPRLHTVPSGRANNNSPRIVGSAPGAERVKIFATVNCSGAPVANVSAAELGAGVTAHVADNSVTDFAGISVAGGKQSFCSPPATYIEDSTPPRTRITMAPGTKTRRHKAVFRFTDTSEDPLTTSFQCKVDNHRWKPCHSPFKLRHLKFHRYVLQVRGTDEIGNAETKPAKRSFKVIH
ncbi:MAG: hypothetical protein QOF85_1877 [Solirubrobacterales bacterium]|nr:hypothetical protein [Solirubrobacterales bacterium]